MTSPAKLGRASAAPSAPPTWWAWTPWPTSSRRCGTPGGLRPTPSTPASPRRAQDLIEMGNLGQKTKAGFFKEGGPRRAALRPRQQGLRASRPKKTDEVYARMLKKPAAERLRKLLRNAEGRWGQFLNGPSCATASTTPPCTFPSPTTPATWTSAMRWGFGMKQGPFELWQGGLAGTSPKMVQGHRRWQGAVQSAPLPEWVFKGPWPSGGVHHAARFVEPDHRPVRCRAQPAVYARQHFPRACWAPTPRGASGHHPVRGRVHPPVDAGWQVLIASIKDQDARHRP